jgi:alpha-ribazole phosphatase CobZ
MNAGELLSRKGVTMSDLVEAGFELYVEGDEKASLAELKEEFRTLLERMLADPNVSLLLEAASHLDEIIKSDSDCIFHGIDDPEALVADELIGMSLAEYICGKKALFNYIRYDQAKPGILAKLPPFMDDAVGALVAATMTKLFEDRYDG